MKALSLTQPWASLIAGGHKRIETRSWLTHYRGPLAIHAAKGFPRASREFAEERYAGRVAELPLGAVVAVCRVVDVRRVELLYGLTEIERRLGNFGAGRYGWMLDNVVPLAHPIAARGAQGLWSWEPPAGLIEPQPFRLE